MSNTMYNSGKGAIVAGASAGSEIASTVNMLSDDVCMMALEDDTGESVDDDTVADIIASGGVEVTSTGYTGGHAGAGRISLSSKTYTIDDANNRFEFDCANITWTSISRAASETWVAFVVFKEGTSDDSDAQALLHIDTGTGIPITPNGSNIEFQVNSEGLLQIA